MSINLILFLCLIPFLFWLARDTARRLDQMMDTLRSLPTYLGVLLAIVMLPTLCVAWLFASLQGTLYPPKMGEFLLSTFAPKDTRDSIIGDLAEKFADDLAKYGQRRATWLYWLDTSRSLGPILFAKLRDLGFFAAVVEFGRRKIGL